MNKLLSAILLLIPLTVTATTGRILQLQGNLISMDKTQAMIQDEKGMMKVPASAVDREHVRIGQWIVVSVDFVDFYRMNPEKFAKAK